MSKIEVDAIDKQSGSTLTLGGSGTAVTLACGATQSGFGRTGTVDWQTSIKTAASFTAVNGEGYFVDTSSNAVTANLPAGSAGAIVSFKDYAQNFDTNALTIAANGSEKIEGQTFDLVLDTEGAAVTLIYGDATKGWQAVNSNEVTNAAKFVAATGGTITTVCTNFKVHTFTGPGTFCVSCGGNPAGSGTVDYLVVAGGGGGGGYGASGGGAGGFRLSNSTCMPAPLTSPLANPSGIPVTAQGYPITVGGGGPGGIGNNPGPKQGCQGSTSTFSSISSAGGGGGKNSNVAGATGGSGSGGRGSTGSGPATCSPNAGGAGNTPPVSPSQGNNGGAGLDGRLVNTQGGGGGGAGAVGGNATAANGGVGGVGSFVVQAGFAGCNGTTGPVSSTRYFSGGGGGSSDASPGANPGGSGGGGSGGFPGNGNAGTTNTGGGGGGGGASPSPSVTGGAGGSGIVIIRYKFQ